MEKRWRLFLNTSRSKSTAEGLSIDDILPVSVDKHNSPPILHLYTFVPSAIVGKYQDIESALDIERCKERNIEFNRRSTGGGTVIMGPDVLALGLGINVDHQKMKKGGIAGAFETFSSVLTKALSQFGINAYFRAKNDIEVHGRKIAGLSASSETGKALLFHTSLLVGFDMELMTYIMKTPLIKLSDKGYSCFSQRLTTVRAETGKPIRVQEVMNAVKKSFEEIFEIEFLQDEPDEWERKEIERFKTERYTNPKWIFSHKHPRARMGVGRVKTKGGLLEIYLSLAGASIENVMITGDFFSTTKEINLIENSLKWIPARVDKIEEKLRSIWQDEMIYGVDIHTLTDAIMKAKENQIRL